MSLKKLFLSIILSVFVIALPIGTPISRAADTADDAKEYRSGQTITLKGRIEGNYYKFTAPESVPYEFEFGSGSSEYCGLFSVNKVNWTPQMLMEKGRTYYFLLYGGTAQSSDKVKIVKMDSYCNPGGNIKTVKFGEKVTLTAECYYEEPVIYEWTCSDPAFKADSKSVKITAAQCDAYHCNIYSAADPTNNIGHYYINIIIDNPIEYSIECTSGTTLENGLEIAEKGAEVELTIRAKGGDTKGISYTWQKVQDGVSIPISQTGSKIKVKAEPQIYYEVIAIDRFGNLSSIGFGINIRPEFTLEKESEITDMKVEYGKEVKLKPTYKTSVPSNLSFKWFRNDENGQPIELGCTKDNYVIASAKSDEIYCCELTDSIGNSQKTFFRVHPDNKVSLSFSENEYFVQEGDSITLSPIIKATNKDILKYQWSHATPGSEVVIDPDQTGATYTVSDIKESMCVYLLVTDPAGSYISDSVAITVGEDPAKDTMSNSIRYFVNRIYSYVLNREPENEGVNFWVDELYNFRRSGAEVAQGFIFSPEFEGRGTDNETFISILYRTFFDREPDEDGMNYWLNMLSSGQMDRVAVANGFIFSQEWADTCGRYGIRSGGDKSSSYPIDPNDKTYAFVERMYTTAMDRESDPDGKEYWANELSNFRCSGETVGAAFFLSDEMNSFGLDNKEFITRLYYTFMGREPDADGLNYWVGRLDQGASRPDAVLGFTRSPEFTEKCVSARILPY